MATSRSHGSSSSNRDLITQGLLRLKTLSSSKRISPIVAALGTEAKLHLVGGTVRDALVGAEGYDLDLACAFEPTRSLKLLQGAGFRVIETGIEHGTLTVVVDGENVEITAFRQPGNRTHFACSQTIEEDLNGRDFTLNAIAFSITNNTLVDPLHGAEDLANNIIRAVGDPKIRFQEDPLRILRMIRCGPAFGRAIDKTTSSAAMELKELLREVSVERIRSEIEKMLLAPHPKEAFRALRDLELLPFTLPEMIPSVNFPQNEFHTEDVFEHTLTVVENAVPDRIVKLSALFHDLGKPASLSVDPDGSRHFYQHEEISEDLCLKAMHRLKFSNDDINQVRALVRHHMRPFECGPAGIRRIIRDLSDNFPKWRELKIADRTPKAPSEEFQAALAKFDSMVETEKNRRVGSPFESLAIDGNDLIAIGMRPSPEMGKLLKELMELVTENPELNVKETLVDRAKNLLNSAKK